MMEHGHLPVLVAITDDLTGATDLALTLSRNGMRVPQTLGIPTKDTFANGAEVIVVSLKSRTTPAAEAVTQSVAAGTALLAAGVQQLFFKYCSTFDSTDQGNVGPVTQELRRSPARLAHLFARPSLQICVQSTKGIFLSVTSCCRIQV